MMALSLWDWVVTGLFELFFLGIGLSAMIFPWAIWRWWKRFLWEHPFMMGGGQDPNWRDVAWVHAVYMMFLGSLFVLTAVLLLLAVFGVKWYMAYW